MSGATLCTTIAAFPCTSVCLDLVSIPQKPLPIQILKLNLYTFSNMSDMSVEPTRRSPFRNLRRRLSRLGSRGADGSVEASNPPTDVFNDHQNEQDGRPGQNSTSKRNEQPTELWIPSDEEDASSMTARKRSLKDVAIVQALSGSSRIGDSSQGPPKHSHSGGTFRVPYIFEFAPFPRHICMGRGTIPLGTIIVSIDSNSEVTPAFKFNASFQRLLNKYNHRNLSVANDLVELRNVTKVTLRSRVEFNASVRLVREMRERKVLVVTLFKSYPGCKECKKRGKVDDNPPS